MSTTFISVSANHKYINKIIDKAKALKLSVTDEISWDSGFKYADRSSENIKVIEHSDAMWKYLVEIEPTAEDTKRKRMTNGSLTVPTAEEVLKLGY